MKVVCKIRVRLEPDEGGFHNFCTSTSKGQGKVVKFR